MVAHLGVGIVLDFGLPSFSDFWNSLSPLLCGGLSLVCLTTIFLGSLVLWATATPIEGPPPDGVPVDVYYDDIEARTLSSRLGWRGMVAIGLGVGLLFGGCGLTMVGMFS